MAGPWLYSIAEKAERLFTLRDGTELPVSLESYEKLVKSRKIVEDAWWYIKQNWNNVEIDDEVFIYTGDNNRGIIGHATVHEVKYRSDDWYIRLEFDLEKCKLLFANPIPASKVRQWVHFPRRNVINLEQHEDEIHRLMSRKLKKRS